MCGRKVDISQERTNKETNKQTKQANKPSLCPRWRWHLLGEVGNSQLTNFFGPTRSLGSQSSEGNLLHGNQPQDGQKKQFLMESNQKTFLQMAENQEIGFSGFFVTHKWGDFFPYLHLLTIW